MTELNYTLTKRELHLYPEGSFIVTNEGKQESPFTEILVYIDTEEGRTKMKLSELVGHYIEITVP